MNKKLIVIIVAISIISLVASVSIASASGRTKNVIHKERDVAVEAQKKLESDPQKGTVDERVALSENFKKQMLNLADEESQQGLTASDTEVFESVLELSLEGFKNDVFFYETNTEQKSAADTKNYKLAMKKIAIIENLTQDYKTGKISASEGLKKLESLKVME